MAGARSRALCLELRCHLLRPTPCTTCSRRTTPAVAGSTPPHHLQPASHPVVAGSTPPLACGGRATPALARGRRYAAPRLRRPPRRPSPVCADHHVRPVSPAPAATLCLARAGRCPASNAHLPPPRMRPASGMPPRRQLHHHELRRGPPTTMGRLGGEGGRRKRRGKEKRKMKLTCGPRCQLTVNTRSNRRNV